MLPLEQLKSKSSSKYLISKTTCPLFLNYKYAHSNRHGVTVFVVRGMSNVDDVRGVLNNISKLSHDIYNKNMCNYQIG